MMKSAPAPNVDAYLDSLSEDKKAVLEHLRQVIKSAAPEAKEVISYGMPAYDYHGILCYFAAFEKHFSLFAVHKEPFLNELKDFKVSKGTIQFTAKKPLPDDLVRRIVQFRLQENKKKNFKVMASVGTYLNFPRHTEEAFNFYKSVFGTEFTGDIMRFGGEQGPDGKVLPEEDQKLVMHVALPIVGGHLLMGTDAPESMGFNVQMGNNSYICLTLDTRVETKRLFDALSADGNVEMELQDTFWGSYYGICKDKYGVQWMFDCGEKVA